MAYQVRPRIPLKIVQCGRLAAFITLVLLAFGAAGTGNRSRNAVAEFRASHECPATGRKRGPCRGYQVDHVIPLCAGGPDEPRNMQWLSVESHKLKTKNDVKFCRSKSTWRQP